MVLFHILLVLKSIIMIIAVAWQMMYNLWLMTSAGCGSFKGFLWIQELLICLNLKCLGCRKVLTRGRRTLWYLLHDNLKQCWKLHLSIPTSSMMTRVLRHKMFL